MGYLVLGVLSFAAGGVASFLAARKFPKAFGFVVATVNKVDDAINQKVSEVVKK